MENFVNCFGFNSLVLGIILILNYDNYQSLVSMISFVNISVTQLIYRKPPLNDSAVHLAVRRNNSNLLSTLISCGAPVNLQNRDGHTGLHLACMLGDEDMVQVFLQAKANVYIVDFENKAAIFWAAERGFSR